MEGCRDELHGCFLGELPTVQGISHLWMAQGIGLQNIMAEGPAPIFLHQRPFPSLISENNLKGPEGFDQ